MKQLTCEMCGSTDLMKQDGVFVCQTCGCKYSVEEARKMMVEGTVEVQGTVNIDNSAKIENLFTMANSAYESKNFAKAEEFCNQIIALDDENYKAWLLKGKAINYQIGVNNQRILEVYNCIMTAYRLRDKAEAGSGALPELEEKIKKLDKLTIVNELKSCMEGEVDFWVQRFENDRPSESTFTKLKNTYIDCYNKMKAAYEEFGLETETYLKNFDNHFCEKCNTVCVSAWKTTVAYNYFRHDLNNLGKNWNRNPKKTENGTDYFRPNVDTFATFIEEAGLLVRLLQYCEEQFNDLTPHRLREAIYSNIAWFKEVPIDQWSYKAMVSTTTNGYGAVTNRREYYQLYDCLSDKAKELRRKDVEKYRRLKKEAEDAAIKAEAEERERKKKEFWEKNAELQAQLQSENNALAKEIAELNKALDNLPERAAAKKLEEEIDKLKKERDSLGLFKGKEKKALQERIDTLNREESTARNALDAAIAPIKKQLEEKEKRQKEINEELTKDRD